MHTVDATDLLCLLCVERTIRTRALFGAALSSHMQQQILLNNKLLSHFLIIAVLFNNVVPASGSLPASSSRCCGRFMFLFCVNCGKNVLVKQIKDFFPYNIMFKFWLLKKNKFTLLYSNLLKRFKGLFQRLVFQTSLSPQQRFPKYAKPKQDIKFLQ